MLINKNNTSIVVVVNTGGNPQPQPQPATGINVVVSPGLFYQNPHPVAVRCPSCQRNIVTVVTKTTSMIQWLICLGLCLFGFWLCC